MRAVLISVSSGLNGKGHKVLLNGIQEGAEFKSPSNANRQATALRDDHYPTAKLYLAQTAQTD
jgi:hypothetical protein